jgi:RNA polymerase sigma factor (sigma-70 family)
MAPMTSTYLDMPPDEDLVHAAWAGEVSALGLLLARHRAALLAVAISLVGYGPDAEDAVQEASVIALRRIGDLREPAAAGSWLRTVVRNVCRMQHRARVERPLDADVVATLCSAEPDPAELLEQHVTRDWVWHALEDLSPPLRLVVMLRYFSRLTEYQDIAAACGVPIGTVRSRLNEARAKLARALLATADAAHGDARTHSEARRRDAEELLAAVPRGDLASAFAASWSPTVEISGVPGFQAVGYGGLIRQVEQDLADGVGTRLTNVVASRDIALCEFELQSPAWDPQHCPPGAGWLLHLRAGWVERARLFHLRRHS